MGWNEVAQLAQKASPTFTGTMTAEDKVQIGPDSGPLVTLSARTNGSGKTELIAQFATGSPIVIATQP